MSRVLLFNKPYGALCQFTGNGTRPTLREFVDVPGVYPAGRLDADSEGLVVLTDDGKLQHRISHPRHKLAKTYWVQVEGTPSAESIAQLATGVDLGDYTTKPTCVRLIAEPVNLWPRHPPIRFRKSVPTSWLEITLVEGKNRQIRRMMAALDLPTLRLIRIRIGDWSAEGLAPGEWREASSENGH